MRKYITVILLTLIVLGGFLIRIYNIHSNPLGLFCDEAATGYNAYTIFQSGRDEYGEIMPALFRSFEIYRPGFPMYFTAPFVGIFGLSEFTTRLPSVIVGTANIVVIYFLTTLLFKSKKAGLLSAFFLAISPWHIHFSRYAEGNIYLPFFASLGVLLFILAVKHKRDLFFGLSGAVFGIGLYTYYQAYYLMPLFIGLLSLIYCKQILKLKSQYLLFAVTFLICSIPLIYGLHTGTTTARFDMVSRSLEGKTSEEITTAYVSTYLQHFSPDFLFLTGDIGHETHFITRFSVRDLGQLYLWQALFILPGLYYAYKKTRPGFYILLGWIVLYPLGSTAAPFADGGGPFATRSIIGVIPFQILTALGILFILSLAKKHSLKYMFSLAFFVIALLSTIMYLNLYHNQYPKYSSDFWGWQYGSRDIISYFQENQNVYDELIMEPAFNGPDIFFKFYAPEGCPKCKLGTPDISLNKTKRQLFAVTPTFLGAHPEIKFEAQKILYYPNGTPAFIIGEVVTLPDVQLSHKL